MRRTVFDDDHESFRQTLRAFIESEVVPNFQDWFDEGIVPRDVYYKLADLGVFGISVPEAYGGAGRGSHKFAASRSEERARAGAPDGRSDRHGGHGLESHKFAAIQSEELARAGVPFGGSNVHVGLVLPYLQALATTEQKERYFPTFVSGEEMWAIAMTEPGTGSDLAGMKSSARKSPGGTHYVLAGATTLTSGGVHADRVIVGARPEPPRADDRRFGISLFAVDTSPEGYSVGRKLDKVGLRTSDTAELAFTDVKVPVEDLLGEENRGFSYLG